MKITTVKLQENGVLINGVTSLPDDNTGHIQDAYQAWLSKGNEPEPQFTQTELDDVKAGEERRWRNSELSRADIELFKVQDGGSGSVADWRNYRSALRDYPEQDDFPYGERPTF